MTFNTKMITSIALKELYKYGDGFNIEGCDLSKFMTTKQKWMNMCMILDRPLIDGKTLEEITKENQYTLKEMGIVEFNECKVNQAVLMIIEYLRKKKHGNSLLIQIHRESSGLIYIEMLRKMIRLMYKEKGMLMIEYFENKFPVFMFNNGFYLKLINGYTADTIGPHPNYDIIFSLSLMGGLNQQFASGTITLPSIFMPFDTLNGVIDCTRKTRAHNFLIDILPEMLAVTNQTIFSSVVNQFKSENKNKTYESEPLTLNSFKYMDVTVLQIDSLYNPSMSDCDKLITIYDVRAKI